MSTLRTNALLDASGGTTATVNGYAPTLSNMAGRNRIINGDMRIDQRNAGASVTVNSASSPYVTDRFNARLQQATGSMTAQQSTVAPTGFVNSMLFTVTNTTAPAAGDRVSVRQIVEGTNIADLAWGTASATAIAFSFWVRSSIVGTYGVGFINSSENRSYVGAYVVSAANTWEYKTIYVPGDVTGTWLTTTGNGIRVTFDLGSGSNYNASSANTWVAQEACRVSGYVSLQQNAGATWQVTGVQLEAGSIATPFERRLYGQELALCQRYAINYRSAEANGAYYRYGFGECIASTQINLNIVFPVPMRAVPSLTTTGTAANYAAYSRTSVVALSAVPALGSDGSSPYWATILGNTAGSLTQGSAGALMSNNNQSSYLLFTAEL